MLFGAGTFVYFALSTLDGGCEEIYCCGYLQHGTAVSLFCQAINGFAMAVVFRLKSFIDGFCGDLPAGVR